MQIFPKLCGTTLQEAGKRKLPEVTVLQKDNTRQHAALLWTSNALRLTAMEPHARTLHPAPGEHCCSMFVSLSPLSQHQPAWLTNREGFRVTAKFQFTFLSCNIPSRLCHRIQVLHVHSLLLWRRARSGKRLPGIQNSAGLTQSSGGQDFANSGFRLSSVAGCPFLEAVVRKQQGPSTPL